MKIYFVGAGPGDPELTTVKAKGLLEKAQLCIYAGSLVNPRVLDYLPEACRRVDSAGITLDETIALFKEAKQAGIDVIRLHSGDPSIYGAIGEQIRALAELEIDFEIVPGVSSFQASAAALGVELTVSDGSQTIILTRTKGRTPMPEEQDLKHLAQTKSTLCLFLSIHKLKESATILATHYGEDCPVAVVYRASWPDQQIIRGTLLSIAQAVKDAGITRTAMIIVGDSLRDTTAVSKLYAATFTHGYRKGKPA